MPLNSSFYRLFLVRNEGPFMSQIKTGAVCALAGVIGGGVLSYERENSESAEYLRHMDKEIEVLRDRADIHGEYWDSLKNVIYIKDSLLKEYRIAYKEQKAIIQENEKSIDLLSDSIKKQDKEIEKYEKKFGGRYSMEKEFALLYECLYGNSNGYYNSYSSYNYSSYKECCVKAVRKLQQQYPTEKKLVEWESVSQFKCKQ